MGGDVRRAAFFDLVLGTWESFEAARVALEAHRAAGDLLILLVGGPGTKAGAGGAGLLPGDCLTIDTGSDERKSWAVVETMARLGLDASCCFAYADHPDSLGILGVVGNPRVLGDDPELVEYARNRGWPIISPAPPLAC
ncbi:hypothetical protein GCM10020229_20040 [Kitasatospora albolonga]